MANTGNKRILDQGTIISARKTETITIGLGEVGQMEVLKGVVEKDIDGKVRVFTKENPEGFCYESTRTLVVRVIDGQVLINGKYDMYCPENDKIDKLLKNSFDIKNLTLQQLIELAPLFNIATEIRPAISPGEPGRRVIEITREMIEAGINQCYNEWDPETPCTLEEGDFFLVTDEDKCQGYRIGRTEFLGTHVFE